ncbi:MAG: CDP-alcohol phosphatidyltransferase family protein [Planctomycetia bacterium]|nr:CDP-alcohol phosphatidyltransferase family protein [Planctomycetia bacterium]
MTEKEKNLNVPNVLSSLRLVLSAILFALIAVEQYLPAFVLFLITALTDLVDGWWARKFHQCTQVGRILDSFADKILILGTFVFLAAEPRMNSDWKLVQPWMATLILAREMIVTALRSFLEQKGHNFGAQWSGKVKMVFQCITCACALLYLNFPEGAEPKWLYVTLVVSLWVTLCATIDSGRWYIHRAIHMGR